MKNEGYYLNIYVDNDKTKRYELYRRKTYDSLDSLLDGDDLIFENSNKSETKIKLDLLGLRKIKKYTIFQDLNGDLSSCLIEFED